MWILRQFVRKGAEIFLCFTRASEFPLFETGETYISPINGPRCQRTRLLLSAWKRVAFSSAREQFLAMKATIFWLLLVFLVLFNRPNIVSDAAFSMGRGGLFSAQRATLFSNRSNFFFQIFTFDHIDKHTLYLSFFLQGQNLGLNFSPQRITQTNLKYLHL